MKRPVAKGGRGGGALMTLALLLGASASLRTGTNIGQVWAADTVTTAQPQKGVEPGARVCPAPPLAVIQALRTREEQVAVKEAALQERLAALSLAEQAISRRLEELKQAEAALTATLARADGAAEADVEKLTKMYQAMKPKNAAVLFNDMEPQFSAGFLGRMPPESAAAILSGMKPEVAYAVSALLAGRNARAPKQ